MASRSQDAESAGCWGGGGAGRVSPGSLDEKCDAGIGAAGRAEVRHG